MGPELLLVVAVGVVGVLHTMVPDHWLPIALIARQEGWSQRDTARAAAGAGLGHSLSTLVIGFAIWLAGAALAARFANAVSTVASLALIGFGLWIVVGSLRDLRSAGAHAHGHHHHHHQGRIGPHHHEHGHHQEAHNDRGGDAHPHEPREVVTEEPVGHRHRHRHADGVTHTHYHRHTRDTWHATDGTAALAPVHEHDHRAAPRRALLLILGSSPMVEGIPAFLAASRFGFGLILVMAAVFTAATTVTYVALCVSSSAAAERVHLGAFERYGEAVSGAFIAVVGLVFLAWVRW